QSIFRASGGPIGGRKSCAGTRGEGCRGAIRRGASPLETRGGDGRKALKKRPLSCESGLSRNPKPTITFRTPSGSSAYRSGRCRYRTACSHHPAVLARVEVRLLVEQLIDRRRQLPVLEALRC